MQSMWMTTERGRPFPSLEGDLTVDVVVVGAGIAGLTAALLLERSGLEVAVVEAREVAAGESGFTTAHLTVLRDTPYRELHRAFGARGSRLATAGARAAIDFIRTTARELAIDCDLEALPAYLVTDDEREVSSLEEEAWLLRSAGEDARVVRELPPSLRSRAALRIEDQGAFHPRKYLYPLAERIQGGRGHIFEGTRVLEIRDGKPCRVVTERGTLTARHVLSCTDSPITTRVFLHTKLPSYRTYVVGARVERPLGYLAYDTLDPYHYVRTHPLPEGGHLLIVGGEDHRVGEKVDTQECYARLEAWTRARYGEGLSFSYRWSGQVLNPVDGLPYVGRSSGAQHVYVATGFEGSGMTNGTLAGIVLSDAVLERRNPWAALLKATRIKPFASAAEFLKENVDFPRHLVEDRLSPAEAQSLEEVPPGEGRLTRVGLRKLAVYKTPEGDIRALSPVCTHLGCHVHWNSGEKSWDCPCHGSRFDTVGKVLHGPATRALEAVQIDDEEAALLEEEQRGSEEPLLPNE